MSPVETTALSEQLPAQNQTSAPSDIERINKLICWLGSHAAANRPAAVLKTEPLENRTAIPIIDSLIAATITGGYHAYKILRAVRRGWLKIAAPKVIKKSGGGSYLRELLLPLFDRILCAVLRDASTRLKKSGFNSFEDGHMRIKPLAALVYLRGRLFLAVEQYIAAMDFFFAAAVWKAEQKHTLFLTGLSAQLAGRMNDAEAAYRLAIESEQAGALDFFHLGHVLLTAGREEEAVSYLDQAIKMKPSLSMAHQNFAGLYDHSKYVPQSFDLVRHKSALLYDAYNLTGERLVHIGRGEEGVVHYGKALRQQQVLSQFDLPPELKLILKRDLNIEPGEPVRILPYEWVTLIGHIAMLDTHKKLQMLGMSVPGKSLLLAPKHKVANSVYLDLWRKHFHVIEDEALVNVLFPYQRVSGDCFNGYITPEGKSRCWTELGAQGHIAWDHSGRGPLLALPSELRDRGYAALKQFGMKEGEWFVALHVRGGSFHRETKHSIQTHRNAELADYERAIKQITSRGGWVIRMGDSKMQPLPKMERVIDYPHTELKSEWMDVFLAGAARFFVGTTSGLSNVFISLGTPCLLVNCVSNYFQLWNNKVLFTLKPLWNQKEKRYLNLAEMTDNAFRWKLFNIKQLGPLAIVPHANSAEEIENAVIEMLERLENGMIMNETDADRALRIQCEVSNNRNYFGNGRISKSFYESRKTELFNA